MCYRNENCETCGGFGYTIEVNDEGVEFMTGCFDCSVAAMELEYIEADPFDDGEAEAEKAFIYKAEGWA